MEELTPFVNHDLSQPACRASLDAVRDTLYVLNGKWKLPIIIALSGGALRFAALQRVVGDITPKILSKELKDLELNEFVTRQVYATKPVTVVYALTPYSASVQNIIDAMRDWGLQHKKRLQESSRKNTAATAASATSIPVPVTTAIPVTAPAVAAVHTHSAIAV